MYTYCQENIYSSITQPTVFMYRFITKIHFFKHFCVFKVKFNLISAKTGLLKVQSNQTNLNVEHVTWKKQNIKPVILSCVKKKLVVLFQGNM